MISPKKIAFVSWHNYLDQTNGASISTRAILKALSQRNWRVQTFCGPAFDRNTILLEAAISNAEQIRKLSRKEYNASCPYALLSFLDGSIESIGLTPLGKKKDDLLIRRCAEEFLRLYQHYLRSERPGIVLTYCGAHVKDRILAYGRQYGAKTCVLLQNFAYNNKDYFLHSDLTIVPSVFSKDHYWNNLGLETCVLAPLIDFAPLRRCGEYSLEKRKYLAFINPTDNKGVYWFAIIAKELWRLRPDIPILLVEGSSGREILLRSDLELQGIGNLYFAPNTMHPEQIYRLARAILIPSVFNESFCRVAAEAMAACVPIIASNRGAIPETVGDSGIVLEIPRKYQTYTKALPSKEEVQEWISALLSFWDDESTALLLVKRGKARVENLWNEQILADKYEDVLSKLLSQKRLTF